MINVRCHTHLDNVDSHEIWPTSLPGTPSTGNLIRSARVYRQGKVVELEIVRLTWVQPNTKEPWLLDVELHIPNNRWRNLNDFEEWYNSLS